MNFDTIAAVATAFGEGGIGIIRVSGDKAIEIVERCYKGKTRLAKAESHTIHYGHIIDKDDRAIDEVLISVFLSPRSYTTEDVVEINSHGGIMPVKQVLDVILDAGARLAEPGEFTKRAFLNGRIDLSQAEATIDLIRSKTDLSMKAALSQLSGSLSRQITDIRQALLELMAHIEVSIDYPEHDIEEVTKDKILTITRQAISDVDKLLLTADQGKIIREGIAVAIIGRPNVGKSSLLNTLLKENRAIVTDIPGTTRDLLEEYVNIKGIPLKMIDTAGIRDTDNIIEQIGIEKSKDVIQQADLILMLLDVAEPLNNYDISLLQEIDDKNVIILLNKSDLVAKVYEDDISVYTGDKPIISISAKEEAGIDALYDEIETIFLSGRIRQSDATYVTNTRHISLLKNANKSLHDSINSVVEDMPMDMVTIDITNAWEVLGEIIGDTASEGLLDQLFSQFCLGK
jgi:tRNA modification GTPase